MVKTFSISKSDPWGDHTNVIQDFLSCTENSRLLSWNTSRRTKQPTVIARWHDGVLVMKDLSRSVSHWRVLWGLDRAIRTKNIKPIYKTTKYIGGTQVQMAKFLAAFQ